jgi:TonB family protein
MWKCGLLALPLAALAVAADDSRSVLQEIATASRSAASWRVIARTVSTVSVGEDSRTLDLAVTAASQRNGLVRYEIPAGRFATRLVCDSKTAAGSCPTSATGWETLTQSLLGARWNGADTALFEGRDRPCDLIIAQYSALPGLTPGEPAKTVNGIFHRTLCVDQEHTLVLRDEVEGFVSGGPRGRMRIEQKTTYARIERDAKLSPNLFRRDAVAVGPGFNSEPLTRPLPPAGRTAPEVIAKVTPEYTEEAWRNDYEGVAIMLVLVGADGIARDPRLVQPLPYGLDAKAIDAISQWRFRPATQNGRRIASLATIEVRFRQTQ